MAEESIERKVLRAFFNLALRDMERVLIKDIARHAAKKENVPMIETAKLLAEWITPTDDPPAQGTPEKQYPDM